MSKAPRTSEHSAFTKTRNRLVKKRTMNRDTAIGITLNFVCIKDLLFFQSRYEKHNKRHVMAEQKKNASETQYHHKASERAANECGGRKNTLVHTLTHTHILMYAYTPKAIHNETTIHKIIYALTDTP